MQYFRPRVAVLLHVALTAALDPLTQRLARVHGRLQAHGGVEGAEEQLGVRVTAEVDEHHPDARLIHGFLYRLVAQKVWEPHGLVADVMTQGHGLWNVHALWLVGAATQCPPVTIVGYVPGPTVIILVHPRGSARRVHHYHRYPQTTHSHCTITK